jgi:hypothetical protein
MSIDEFVKKEEELKVTLTQKSAASIDQSRNHDGEKCIHEPSKMASRHL